jgi:tRNA threonylcarbamoyl adenosine modification protein YeaZ
MRILGLDTSSSRASVAIAANGRVLGENCYPERGGCCFVERSHHAEILLSLIDECLKSAGFTLRDISGFAVAIGPGSFTGLRIGLSTIKGLAYGADLPLLGVSTLEAWASLPCTSDRLVCSVLDARKREFYAALFQRRAGLLERITPDQVLPIDRIIKLVCATRRDERVLFTGDGLLECRERLGSEIKAEISFADAEDLPTVAGGVALIGEAALRTAHERRNLAAVPRYLRSAEAQEKARKLA